jgi:hypothetical protein
MSQIPRPPRNLEEIKTTFGDPADYLDETGEVKLASWESKLLRSLFLPAPLSLSWLPGVKVKRIRCHRLILPVFDSVYKAIHDAGLWAEIDPFGGCYCFRRKTSSGSELSTHSWGIAVDHRPEQNPMGGDSTMNEKVIMIFRSYGFFWGGDWAGSGKDAMHFQFSEGY